MLEIRLHGRGGEGSVTSAELLARAAINEGRYGQAFPSFGPERRGAPVVAFCRINDHPIRVRSYIYAPDVVLVLNASVLRIGQVLAGLKPEGWLIANSGRTPAELRAELGYKGALAVVDASRIAKAELGIGITNTTMLGALLKAVPAMALEALEEPVGQRFGRLAGRNLAALRRAQAETVLDF